MGRKESELNKKIELNGGYEEIRRNLDVLKKRRKRKQGGIGRREKVENQLPAIQEDSENEMGLDSGETEEGIGGQNQQETNIPLGMNNENNENVELGGAK